MLDIENIAEVLKTKPETNKTLLGKLIKTHGNTEAIKMKRKLRMLVKYGFIMVGSLEGTRFGESIYYNKDKTYTIFIIRSRTEFSYYYCSKHEDKGDCVILYDCCKLNQNNCCWDKMDIERIQKTDIWRWF